MNKPRILITGAPGFVGAQIVANLGDKFEVHGTSRTFGMAGAITWHAADLREPDDCAALVRDVKPAHLIHSAW